MEAICCEMSWLRSCLLIRLQDKTQFPPESCSLQTTRCQVSVQRCVGPDHALLEPLLSQLHILTCQSCVSSGQLFQSEHLSVFIYLHLSSDFRLSLSECGQGSLLFIRLVRVIAYGIKVSFALRSVWGVSRGRWEAMGKILLGLFPGNYSSRFDTIQNRGPEVKTKALLCRRT